MSVLETPRVYFRGMMSWNSIATNNYEGNYDEGPGETIMSNGPDVFRQDTVSGAAASGNWTCTAPIVRPSTTPRSAARSWGEAL